MAVSSSMTTRVTFIIVLVCMLVLMHHHLSHSIIFTLAMVDRMFLFLSQYVIF